MEGNKRLREGWTTGTTASVAAKAATLILLGKNPDEIKKVSVPLPIRERRAELEIVRKEKKYEEGIASAIKDGGDDPDVTSGAEIIARVFPSKEKGIKILGGEGVGKVTKPGLGVEIGEPDITPIPQKMIKLSVMEAIEEMGFKDVDLCVEIIVPEGKERAKKTMLPRLGVVDGIGILGTMGIVLPYSTGAWRASISRHISVIKSSGYDVVVATTGRQSEEFAMRVLNLPQEVFIDMGDFIGHTLKTAEQKRISRFIYAGFIGKISKVAKGIFFTHAKKEGVDIDFLADLVRDEVSEEIYKELKKSNTARELLEKAKMYGTQLPQKVAKLVKKNCEEYAKISVEVIIFDFDGKILSWEK